MFDTSRFDPVDVNSLYKAITLVELKPEEKVNSLVEFYNFKIIENGLDIPFKINQHDFIEFLIRNKVYFIGI